LTGTYTAACFAVLAAEYPHCENTKQPPRRPYERGTSHALRPRDEQRNISGPLPHANTLVLCRLRGFDVDGRTGYGASVSINAHDLLRDSCDTGLRS
jgi:hypothetical protein